MERCVFCGNTRKSAPLVRFFAVPKEPGLKRIQWLYALGDKEMGPKDRVCFIYLNLLKLNLGLWNTFSTRSSIK